MLSRLGGGYLHIQPHTQTDITPVGILSRLGGGYLHSATEQSNLKKHQIANNTITNTVTEREKDNKKGTENR